jgi:hypothetical protein
MSPPRGDSEETAPGLKEKSSDCVEVKEYLSDKQKRCSQIEINVEVKEVHICVRKLAANAGDCARRD